MKLTEIAINGPGTNRTVRLQQLSDGLNVMSDSGICWSDRVSRFVDHILFGEGSESAINVRDSGHLQISTAGSHYLLARPDSGGSRELTVSDIRGTPLEHWTTEWLSQLDRPLWQQLFQINLDAAMGQDHASLTRDLVRHFDISPCTPQRVEHSVPFATDPDGIRLWRQSADARLQRLNIIREELELLDREAWQRSQVETTADLLDREHHDSLQQELAILKSGHDAVRVRIRLERQRLAGVEQEITRLAATLSARQRPEEPLDHGPGAPGAVHRLAWFVEETDRWIGHWQQLQDSVQARRLALRDQLQSRREAGTDVWLDPETRDILASLQSGLDEAGQRISGNDEVDQPLSDVLQALHSGMRSLRDSMEQWYGHSRNHAWVAELKHLRLVYRQAGEYLRELAEAREKRVAEIRSAEGKWTEPTCSGAADEEFRSPFFQVSAQDRSDGCSSSDPRLRMQELEATRRRLRLDLGQLEAERDDFDPQRQRLVNRMLTLASPPVSGDRCPDRELQARASVLRREQQQLENRVRQDRSWYDWQPEYFLKEASGHVARLTGDRWSQILFDENRNCWLGAPGRRFETLQSVSPADQSLVRLGLCLSAVAQMALRGIRMPLLVENRLSDGHDRAILETLDSFCRQGHQVLLFTRSAAIVQLANHRGIPVHELPDTRLDLPGRAPAPDLPRPEFPALSPAMDELVHAVNEDRWLEPSPETSASGNRATPLARHEFPTAPISLEPVDRPGRTRQPEPVQVQPDSPLHELDLVESIYVPALAGAGIQTVEQLLDLDLDRQGPDLVKQGFGSEQLEGWQSQARLLLALPGLELLHSRILVMCGIGQPADLRQIASGELRDRILDFLESPVGRRSGGSVTDFELTAIQDWQEQVVLAADQVPATRPLVPVASDRVPRPRAATYRNSRHEAQRNLTREPVGSPGDTRLVDPEAPANGKTRVYLSCEDPLKRAPSIGPRTVERFGEIGVRTVGEFLNRSPAEMAARLDNRRLSERVLGQWQDQSRLMCQIPNLRGVDVRILVQCGIADVESLREASADELSQRVAGFVNTGDGQRVLRNSKPPAAADVLQWIEAAGAGRQRRAA